MSETVQSPGARLREARTQKKLSEKEAADSLHLSMSYLRALEADDYKLLPEAAFIKGYLRNYARLLGLPAEELVGLYEASRLPVEPKLQTAPAAARREASSVPRKWLWLGLVLGVVAVIWLLSGNNGDEVVKEASLSLPTSNVSQVTAPAEAESVDLAAVQPVMDVSSTTSDAIAQAVGPVVAAPLPKPAGQVSVAGSTDAASAAGPLEAALKTSSLEIHFAEKCWVEVVDATGRSLVKGTYVAGTRLALEGTAPFQLMFGNAAAVAGLSVDGKAVARPLPVAGEVVRLQAP